MMSNIRRYYLPDSIIFITSVIHERKSILVGENLVVLWDVLRNVQELKPFSLLAYCFLPDHFHWLLKMPDQNHNFSEILHSVKRNFSREFKKKYQITESMQLWQTRFWDHVIRDEIDLETHLHYIHYNPVKHQYVANPEQWEASSFRFWQKKGLYPDNWRYEPSLQVDGQYGE